MKTWENVSRGHGTSFVLVLGPFKITGGPLELQAQKGKGKAISSESNP